MDRTLDNLLLRVQDKIESLTAERDALLATVTAQEAEIVRLQSIVNKKPDGVNLTVQIDGRVLAKEILQGMEEHERAVRQRASVEAAFGRRQIVIPRQT